MQKSVFHLGVICGGPSRERGISLNSARSILDHLSSEYLKIHPLYVDQQRQFFPLEIAALYSNTPTDFDFKLKTTSKPLTKEELKARLKTMDLVFPAIHGTFGETGELQEILEAMGVPFVGSGSKACQAFFYKHSAAQILLQNGFGTLPAALLSANNPNNAAIVERFFKTHQLQRFIIKPSAGGSSIGVFSVRSSEEALRKAQEIFNEGIDTHALLEPFVEGREFTVVLFENKEGEPFALIPSEIDVSYADNGIFDYRRKYLPTTNTRYYTPPRFSPATINHIRSEAKAIFKLFGMKDCARIDGWLLDNGALLFTDINPISGMEQNSFVFRQGSLLGLTHQDVLMLPVKSACRRHGISEPTFNTPSSENRTPVYVLFGGQTAERQVSLMSGTNVWLKLRKSDRYSPTPFFWDMEKTVWTIPYSYALNHTAEEVSENCLKDQRELQAIKGFVEEILKEGKLEGYGAEAAAQNSTIEEFIKKAKADNAFVFIALHGGSGENGELQAKLEEAGIPFNGSGSKASFVCMDKKATGMAIQAGNVPGLYSLAKVSLSFNQLLSEDQQLWEELTTKLASPVLILKPQRDGCSAGIVKLTKADDLLTYVKLAKTKTIAIPPNTFDNQPQPIEMPTNIETDYLFEPYIQTSNALTQAGKLTTTLASEYIELTVGVLEKNGAYTALPPSITLCDNAVLSLEEKFQGGTGVNLTPPPLEILTQSQIETIQEKVAKAAELLGIENYARLDIFFNRKNNEVILIEANTLPGLTASTVIYHQALAMKPSLPPLSFLEKLIDTALSNKSQNRANIDLKKCGTAF